MTLHEFEQYPRCQKCGGRDVTMRYHEPDHLERERIAVRCNQCGFDWAMRCISRWLWKPEPPRHVPGFGMVERFPPLPELPAQPKPESLPAPARRGRKPKKAR